MLLYGGSLVDLKR